MQIWGYDSYITSSEWNLVPEAKKLGDGKLEEKMQVPHVHVASQYSHVPNWAIHVRLWKAYALKWQ